MQTTLRAAVLAALLIPAAAQADNYARCILKKMPGTDNDIQANAVYQLCTKEFPFGLAAVEQGSGRGWFGYKSGAECTAEKAAGTRSNRAAYLISTSCRKLYDEPSPFAQ